MCTHDNINIKLNIVYIEIKTNGKLFKNITYSKMYNYTYYIYTHTYIYFILLL